MKHKGFTTFYKFSVTDIYMTVELLDKINQNVKVKLNKCKICPICADHCDFGCPKKNIEEEIVEMKLVEICISFNVIIYKCRYNNIIYDVLRYQILE